MATAKVPTARVVIAAAAVAAIVVLFASARFYTDVLWFREVGLSSVLWRSIATQFATGAVAGLVAAAFVWTNLTIARRVAPGYAPSRFEAAGLPDPFRQYRDVLVPLARPLHAGIAIVFGLVAGFGAANAWERVLLWANRARFGVQDPQFGRDIGFYVFEWPLYRDILDLAWTVVVVGLLLTVAAHLLYGSVRFVPRFAGVRPAAIAHVSVIMGLLALVRAAQYWLDQFGLNFSPRGTVTGASYTDVHAQLPALQLLMFISIASAVLFLVYIRVRRIVLPLAAVGIWILTAILAGQVWPAVVQQFSVAPQELERERPYIERNIEATRAAFGVDEVESRDFVADPVLTPAEADAGSALLENVRLWDPDVLKRAYGQLQSIKTYYGFEDVDIDRYEIDGRTRQVLLATRELKQRDLPEQSQTFANLRLQYTHGFGVVASLANASTEAGQPEFLIRDVPAVVDDGADVLAPSQPRLYYGEGFEPGQYSIVNTAQDEIDYPLEAGVERTRYEGSGGIPLRGPIRRTAFAIRQGLEYPLVISRLIRPDSKILIYRNVRDRVLRAAPFLSLDHDPYPAVVDGRVLWILDAYTSSPYYPYSQRVDTGAHINSTAKGVLNERINYVRNSVKVTVDAYDGTIRFYIVDDDDPIIRAWRSAFPDMFEGGDPPPSLREHFRYPEDLFNVQSEIYRVYHMTDPAVFYAREDQWDIARRPVPPRPEAGAATAAAVPAPEPTPGSVDPTYLLMTLPGESEEEFVLTRPFTPRQRNVMVSFMAARADPDVYGRLVTLEFPSSRPIEGPVQINNFINQDVSISRDLSLLNQRGSQVIFGSLVILPIQDSIMYIQPLFVQAAEQEGGIPELKRVVVVSGQEIVMADSFTDALEELFGPGDDELEPAPPPAEEPEPPARGEVARLIDRAADLYDRAQAALADGDFERYGRLIEELGEVISRTAELSR